MARLVLTDASITINSVDLSDHSNSVTLNYEVDSIEVTAFGDSGHSFDGGLQNNTLEITLHQDFGVSSTEATIYPLVGTQTTVVIKPASGAVAADNPSYTLANCFLAAHNPVAGGVGELAATSLSFTGGTLTKTTS